MIPHRHVDSTLIDRVGVAAVTAAFNVTPQRLHNWRRRGIPALLRIRFAKIAAERGIAVPQSFLDEISGENHGADPVRQEVA